MNGSRIIVAKAYPTVRYTPPTELQASDVNNDGQVDENDASRLEEAVNSQNLDIKTDE